MPLSHHRLEFTCVAAVVDQTATAKILIVDDDEGVTQTFARMLRLEGYQVATAISAQTGLQEADSSHPDAIILDLRMPLLDGLGFLRKLALERTTSVASPWRSSPATISSTMPWRPSCAIWAPSSDSSRCGSKISSASRVTCSR